jgi:hypothetical protein
MKKPASTKDKAKAAPVKTAKSKIKAKAQTHTPARDREKKPTKPRRRPGIPFNLKILFPKQEELRKAIFSGHGVHQSFRDHLVKAGLVAMGCVKNGFPMPDGRVKCWRLPS